MGIEEGADKLLAKFILHIEDNADAMFYVDDNGQFYFIVGKKWDVEGFAEKTGYLIVDSADYNERYVIGWGVYSLANMKCLVSGNFSDWKF